MNGQNYLLTATRWRMRNVCTLGRIVFLLIGSVLFFSSVMVFRTHKSKEIISISGRNTLSTASVHDQALEYISNQQKVHFEKLSQRIIEVKEELEQIKDSFKEQDGWKEHLANNALLLKAIPVAQSKDIARKSNSHVIMDNVDINCNTHHKLLVLVSSNAPNFERRNIIRAMWGNHTMWNTKEKWKVIFVLGFTRDKNVLNNIQDESKLYKDIMLEDVKESFYHLTYKVMIGLHWAYTSFKFDFILKCDDDVFVQVDRMINKITSDYKNKDYIGHLMTNQPLMRTGRYGVSKKEYKNDRFDPYCSGGGFLISQRTIGKVIPLFNWDKPLKIDDAYIGHLVFKTGVKGTTVQHGFYMWNDWCEYNEHLLISHPAKNIKCMTFLLQHSLIENGKLINDTIKNKKHLFKPTTTTTTTGKLLSIKEK